MKWRRLTLRVDPPDVELASAVLAQATGAAVALDEPLDGSRPSVFAYVPARRAKSAASALERRLTDARSRGLLRSARRSSATLADERWSTSWKRYYEPSLLAPGVWVVPPWRSRGFRPPVGSSTIILDPGMAFGTGQHATTKMAAALLLERVLPRAPVLDVGCGSGILSIVAALRGGLVFASDVDPLAVRATRTNLRANGIAGATVLRAAGVPPSFPRAAVVVANITADVLTPLAASFAAALLPGGSLVTSGVAARGRRAMLSAFRKAGMRCAEERRSGEWFAFLHVRSR